MGIDLGTTNSCVGVMNETQTEVVLFETAGGSSTTPSCVWYDERNNEVVVGRDAYVRRGSLPAPVVSVKRSMGKLVLIPLGKASKIPGNIPQGVRQSLSETREERLQRYLSREEASVREKKRANPSLLWVLDQAERLGRYLSGMDDPRARAEVKKDPPLLWLPEEISALILAEERQQILIRQRELDPGNTHVADRCLITVPAYFGAEQMEATKEAGVLAGIEVLELLQEPSAAAVYYCWKSRIQDGLFMVFDLGGGTFDVSILRRQGGWSQVLGISGDNLLGGDDFDGALAEFIRATVAKENPGCDLQLDMARPEDKRIWDGLVFMAEGVKKALSREEDYLLRDTNASDRAGARLNIDMKITRARFESLIAPLIEKCIPKCWEAIAKAKLKSGVSLADMNQIFLVGGATHVPCVQLEVRRRFCSGEGAIPYTPAEVEAVVEGISGDDAQQTEELRKLAREMLSRQERAGCAKPMIDKPDLCVALGAAVQAGLYGVKMQGDHANIVVTSPRSTSEGATAIAGTVTASEGVKLLGATVYLTGDSTDVGLEFTLSADGGFAFRGVPLRMGAESSFDLSVLSDEGFELARSRVKIAQVGVGSVRVPDPGSTATVSRPYTLNVVRHGIVTRKVLVPSGASLPIEREPYELAVPDPNKGVIYFKVFQGYRLLKSIEAFVDPTVRPGTPITFTFSIGRDHMMRATYQIAGDPDEHPVVIEPPDSLKPSKVDVSKLKDAISQEIEYLEPVKRESFKIRFEKLADSAREADAKGDEPKLIDRYEQLQGLREEILQDNVQIKPSWLEFEKSYGACTALLDSLKKQQPDYPDAEVRQNLSASRGAAKTAYGEKAQDRYAVHVEAVQNARKSLSRDYHRAVDETVSPVQRAKEMIGEHLEIAKNLLRKAEDAIRMLENNAKSAQDVTVKSSLINHSGQCRQCRDNVLTCQTGLMELMGSYTSDPKGTIDKCQTFSPILNNARNVLDQKQSILNDKVVSEQDPVLPWDLKG